MAIAYAGPPRTAEDEFHVVSLPNLFPEHEGGSCSLARLRCTSGLRNCLRAGALTGVTDPLITAGYPRGFTLSLRTSFGYDRFRRNLGARAGAGEGLLAAIAVPRCRTQDFPILILRLLAVRIFCRVHVDPERRAAPSGSSCPCEELATTKAMEPETGLGFGTTSFALPYSHEGPVDNLAKIC
jgi:hypothetical protein